MSMYRFSDKSLLNRQGIDQRLIDISDLALAISAVDFGIPKDGGLRTAERQHELHLAGVSKCDGYIRKSEHQSGKAIDFFAVVRGLPSWEVGHLAIVGAAFLQAAICLDHKIRWGGFFTPFDDHPFNHGWDCPHIELMDVNP